MRERKDPAHGGSKSAVEPVRLPDFATTDVVALFIPGSSPPRVAP
jgi:hypothetical protein